MPGSVDIRQTSLTSFLFLGIPIEKRPVWRLAGTQTEKVMEIKKRVYAAPALEVVAMEHEGVIAASTDLSNGGFGNGGTISASSAVNSASADDLEEMLNTLFTVE